jgi:hypothetical protein
MEVETLRTLAGKGHVRHQIEFSTLQPVETLGPLTGLIAQAPALGARHGLQEFDEESGRAAVGVGVDLGCILIETDPHQPMIAAVESGRRPVPGETGRRQHGQQGGQ